MMVRSGVKILPQHLEGPVHGYLLHHCAASECNAGNYIPCLLQGLGGQVQAQAAGVCAGGVECTKIFKSL